MKCIFRKHKFKREPIIIIGRTLVSRPVFCIHCNEKWIFLFSRDKELKELGSIKFKHNSEDYKNYISC